MTPPTLTLSPDQVAFFHREGYLVLDAITTAEEVARMREVYDRLFANRTGRETGNQFDLAGPDEDGVTEKLPQILGPSRYEPVLKDSLYMANSVAIAEQLLGPEAVFQGDHAILKPARYGAETPWHQDEAYWNPDFDYHTLSVWMPLQEATWENGCMCFIPGSHRMEVQTHHSINHDPRVHGLEVDEIDASGMVKCPIPAGGATLHASRTFHYTPPNRSDRSRRAYILGLGAPPTKRETPRDFYWNRMKRTAREARAAVAANGERGLNE